MCSCSPQCARGDPTHRRPGPPGTRRLRARPDGARGGSAPTCLLALMIRTTLLEYMSLLALLYSAMAKRRARCRPSSLSALSTSTGAPTSRRGFSAPSTAPANSRAAASSATKPRTPAITAPSAAPPPAADILKAAGRGGPRPAPEHTAPPRLLLPGTQPCGRALGSGSAGAGGGGGGGRSGPGAGLGCSHRASV